MRTIIPAALLAAALVAAPAVAAADDLLEAPRRRQGGYLAFGIQGGVTDHRDDGRDLGAATGAGGTLRFGQLLTRRFGLGVAIDFAAGSGDGEDATASGYGLEAQLEVAPNLAVRGGVGVGILVLDVAGDDDSHGAYGAAYTVGVSYDWFPFRGRSGGFAITPSIAARVLPEDVAAYSLFVGVELSWWMGLPRRQLALPDDEAY